jgi:hypothetical protein
MVMEKRSTTDRRSIKDRRKAINFHCLYYSGKERRSKENRRSQPEKRKGWVRIGKWSSVYLWDLKIAKFLNS